MSKLVIFGTLCVAAILVGLCSRQDRRTLAIGGSVIAGNWLLFSMPWIYAPASFAFLAYGVGIECSQLDGWAVTELCTLATLIGVCWRAWWAPLLWSPSLINLAMYAVAYANHLEYIDYQNVLDASLSVQLAVIFVWGGPGCADCVLRCWRFCRVVLYSSYRHALSKLASS